MAVKPKLALIPSGYKASKVYSVLPSDGVGDFDFSRSGQATRVNKQGLIETVSSNVPRLNYPMIDGVVTGCPSLLLEPQRSNLVSYSEAFDNAYWNKSGGTSVLANQSISPDGNLNADKITFSSSNQTIARYFSLNSDIYTVSVYVKGNVGETIRLANLGTEYNFTLTGEWQRIEITIPTATSAGNIVISTFGGATAREIFLFGAQLEQGGYATSYIPTSGGIATRSAEVCNGAGNEQVFNDSEGVLMAEISALVETETFRDIRINDGSSNNRVAIRYSTTTNEIEAYVVSNGTETFKGEYISQNISNFNKIAIKYKNNDFSLWINGIEVVANTGKNGGGTPVNLNNINFSTSLFNFYGNTKQIQYFDKALTDAELQALTS